MCSGAEAGAFLIRRAEAGAFLIRRAEAGAFLIRRAEARSEVAVAVASDAVAVFFADADDARQGKSAVTSADLSNRGVGAESSNELPNMDVCAVSRAEADAAAANRSSRRNPKLVVGAVSFAASTPSPAPADGCSRAEAAVSHRHPIRRRPRELVGLQDWIPSGKNWMPP